MSYLVIKKIKGRPYLYQQSTYREGNSVKTKSKYIGALFAKNRSKVNTTKKVESYLSDGCWDRIKSAVELVGITGAIVWNAHSPTNFLEVFRKQMIDFNKYQKQKMVNEIKKNLGDLNKEEQLFFSALFIEDKE